MTVAITNAGSVRRDNSRMVVIAASAIGCSIEIFSEPVRKVLGAHAKYPEIS
ncbi:MAG: hypothetical protein Q8R44_06690 [Novosphingobium sp.]|nr:hypothetical protein [Novosphingobium sp.]